MSGERARLAESLLLLGAAAGGTGLAWLFFASRPPMPVLVGLRTTGAFVPASYQASVFPAFCWFSAALGLDFLRGSGRPTRAPRAALLASTGLLAAARLGGALPLSGHAIFLSAVVVYGLVSPRDRDGAPMLPAALLAAPGLALTAWYKLVEWDDGPWFAASAVVGGVVGLACGAWSRR